MRKYALRKPLYPLRQEWDAAPPLHSCENRAIGSRDSTAEAHCDASTSSVPIVCRPTPLSSCFPAEILSVYIVEYYTHFKILKYIPITTKWELISWVWAILILLPFIIYIYVRYYKPPKLSNLKLIYESKSNIRLILGRLFYVCYCLITWIGFFIIVGCFKH